MAIVTAIEARAGSMRSRGIRSLEFTSSRRQIREEPVDHTVEEKIYVAVGEDATKSKSILLWAIQNSGGKSICVIHVHQPAQMIPMMGARFPANTLQAKEVKVYRDIEREKMHKNLDEYLLICEHMGVQAEKLYIETESIEKGILELISQQGIRKLVMGAAADRRHSRRMMDLKSRKAIFVRQEAPASCHIWFICKGCLIYTREGRADEADTASLSLHASPTTEVSDRQSFALSQKPGDGSREQITYPTSEAVHTPASGNLNVNVRRISDSQGLSTTRSQLNGGGSSDEQDKLLEKSPSQISGPVPHYSSREIEIDDQEGVNVDSSCTSSILDGSIDDDFLCRLQQAMEEVYNSKREAYEEASRRQRAEKDAFEAMRRAKASGTLYSEELKRRKEVELESVKVKEDLEKMKSQQDEVMLELQAAMDQKALLDSQVAESVNTIKELEQKFVLAVNLLQSYKKQREELQIEHDEALREAEGLRKSRSEASDLHLPQFTSFSFSEIEEATRNFDPKLKIGEGGYGSIYKGILRCTQVAIKVLHSNSLQGPSEFQQEIEVLSKVKHPNLITLIGACPEAWALIYEYIPNGSLEDRLCCKDNSPPLPWQIRVCIATELCAALIFLHSCKPYGIVHGDLKPANILLDANLVSKLSDFGICRLLGHGGSASNPSTTFCNTNPKGTFAYMDPEFLTTGELTQKSDVYSFGVILLRLLTGRPAIGITKEVKYALGHDTLKNLLDPLAGDWPFVQAQQLARLALRCCEITRRGRPDIETEVWRTLEPMRASCGGPPSFRLGRKEHFQPPPYFVCPIFQEVMQDPQVAADGYTYEAEALRAWLDSGHDTSPVTNDKLAHTILVPNHTLRHAIQDWLQQRL